MGKSLIIIGADFSKNSLAVPRNITDMFSFTDGKLVNADSSAGLFGKVIDSSVSSASSLVEISGFSIIKANIIYYNKQKGLGGLCFYRDESTPIKGYIFYDPSAENNTMKEQNIVIPEGAKYVRLTVLAAEKKLFKALGIV